MKIFWVHVWVENYTSSVAFVRNDVFFCHLYDIWMHKKQVTNIKIGIGCEWTVNISTLEYIHFATWTYISNCWYETGAVKQDGRKSYGFYLPFDHIFVLAPSSLFSSIFFALTTHPLTQTLQFQYFFISFLFRNHCAGPCYCVLKHTTLPLRYGCTFCL